MARFDTTVVRDVPPVVVGGAVAVLDGVGGIPGLAIFVASLGICYLLWIPIAAKLTERGD
ncbi:hypothetical protein [Conexibacter arvalis]|uniref:Uncharacterized protein n=1 Tax=Conexibacter arvalis TaxID=912552 RepID=A0A840IDP8_9ACTN|nr:hypothetical protein [Conexibacter arvalis]MBB4662194.1 hypothetical protein [Conexibacter arvalis]